MFLQQLLNGLDVISRSETHREVSGIAYDSRQVKPGYAFVAIRGETTDGNCFIDSAISAGASVVITDAPQEGPRAGVSWVAVAHGRRALARISANFYGKPAEKLAITGITGTNGKTTTSFLLDSILRAAGRGAALLGTIEYHVGTRILPAPHTTPEPLELNQVLAEAVSSGAGEAVMEVSSHALAQERVYGIPFAVAVFTNLTRDHLDYHASMEEYFSAKRKLFAGCGAAPPAFAVLNTDDEHGRELQKFADRKSMVLTYGLETGDFRAENTRLGAEGTRFDMITPAGRLSIRSTLVGRINAYNILAAAAAAWARDCPSQAVVEGVRALGRVPGRFETVDAGQPFTVVVDYAHTDDALRNLTAIARELQSQGKAGSRVITVFGCGGDRDRSKRPLMGDAAGRGSDFVVLTSDNPRSEDPLAIMNDALVGLQHTRTAYALEPDRRAAIALAIGEARPGDIVLIAGKGHEKTQATHAGATPFDDVEVVREALQNLRT